MKDLNTEDTGNLEEANNPKQPEEARQNDCVPDHPGEQSPTLVSCMFKS